MNDNILMETNILKDKLNEIKNLTDKVTRSDLQSIIEAEAFKFNKYKVEEIKNIFLLFCDDEININEAKRFLLDLVDLEKVEKESELKQEFLSLINDDDKFNYNENEFKEWLKDNNLNEKVEK